MANKRDGRQLGRRGRRQRRCSSPGDGKNITLGDSSVGEVPAFGPERLLHAPASQAAQGREGARGTGQREAAGACGEVTSMESLCLVWPSKGRKKRKKLRAPMCPVTPRLLVGEPRNLQHLEIGAVQLQNDF